LSKSNSNKRVTSYDVAREAGVSQSAVSRVFRPGLSVSQKTRDKVTEAANRMGYRPNAIARMLITKNSGIVAVIVSSRANLNYPEVLSNLTKRIAEKNKRVLLFTLDEAAALDEILDQLWTYQVDGLIALAAHFEHKSIQQFAQHHIPVVLYNRQVEDQSVSSVSCNHEQGMRQLVQLLVENEHKSFFVVSGPIDSDVANERREFGLSALRKHGFDDTPVGYGDYSYESGRKAFAEFMQSGGKPSAVLCGNDTMAIGVIDEARENFGLSIPADLSVVGFDGINAASWHSYQLTTIKQPAAQMAEAAVEILLNQIENDDSPAESRFWSGKLITGTSVAKAKF
jgi:DNA-binding LacI/PurR family transcriptional regulator